MLGGGCHASSLALERKMEDLSPVATSRCGFRGRVENNILL
jgi:hypothetical protein